MTLLRTLPASSPTPLPTAMPITLLLTANTWETKPGRYFSEGTKVNGLPDGRFSIKMRAGISPSGCFDPSWER